MKKPRIWPPKTERGDGRFEWDGPDHDGRIRLRFQNHGVAEVVYSTIGPDDAKKKRDAKRAAVAEQRARIARLANGEVTVAEMFEAWLDTKLGANLAPGTHDRYRADLPIVRESKIGPMRASDVEPHHVDAMLVALTDRYGYNTLHDFRSRLIAAFKFGVKNKFCSTNPAEYSDMPDGKVRPPKENKWLSVPEYPVMWNYLYERRHESTSNVALLMMMATAMRSGEVLALRWDMVHLSESHLQVARNMQRSNNGRTRTVVPRLKSKKSARKITLPAAAVDMLAEFRRTTSPFGHLFYNDKGQELGPDALRWWLTKACADLGIERLRPHELRHSTGSMLLHLGMTPAECADTLGHTQDVFNKTYRHQLAEMTQSGNVLASVLTSVTG